MLVLVVLALLVPALIGVLCYERFRGCDLNWVERVELFLIFAFLINLATYTILMLRGWDMISWTLTGESTVTSIPVMVQYMAISFVESVVLAYVLSLVRIGQSRPNAARANEEAQSDKETEAETQQQALNAQQDTAGGETAQ